MNAEQNLYDEVYTVLSTVYYVKIYVSETLYDVFVGVPYEFVSDTGELKYRLRVVYNVSNLAPKTALASGVPTVGTKKVSYVQMQQKVSSIALWNPVASIVFASALLPVNPTQTSMPKDVSNINNNFTDSGNNSNLLSTI